MKRRTAGLLVTGTVLLVAGYVAWCARTFYMEPPGIDPAGMPQEVVAATPALADAAGMMRKEEFSVERFFHYLRYPHTERPKLGISATRSAGDLIIVSANSPAIIQCFPLPSSPPPSSGPLLGSRWIFFIRKSGKWTQVPEQEGLLHQQE